MIMNVKKNITRTIVGGIIVGITGFVVTEMIMASVRIRNKNSCALKKYGKDYDDITLKLLDDELNSKDKYRVKKKQENLKKRVEKLEEKWIGEV